MYGSSDSEVSDTFINDLIVDHDYPLVVDGQMLGASTDPFPPSTADQPPPHQVAPDQIQDPSETQMLPDFTPTPPTEEEIAQYRLLQRVPDHIQDACETQVLLPPSAPPTDEPAHPYYQNAPDHIDQDMLAETQILLPASASAPPPPTDEPAHPYSQNVLDHIDQDMLTETQILLPASVPPTDEPAHLPPPTTEEPAHPPHDQNDPNQFKEESNSTHEILPLAIISLPTGPEPDNQPPPHQGAPGDQDESKALMLVPNTTPPPTGSEPDNQPPPHQGAPGDQDESKALMLVPNSTPPPTEPQNHNVVIDIESDSESNSDEVQIIGSFSPSPPSPPPPTTTATPSTSQLGETSILYPVPLSWAHPSFVPWLQNQYRRQRLQYHRGENSDDEKTESDDDVLPPPPPPAAAAAAPQTSDPHLQLAAVALHDMSSDVYVLADTYIRPEPKRPDWLPEDWGMECITRTSGSSAGNRDKYYIEPGRGRKFRSKNEVLHFLETGERPGQSKRKANTAMQPLDVSGPSEGIASSSTQNLRIAAYPEASTSRQNEETPNLDSEAVPEKENEEMPPPNVDSDQNPLKRPRGSPSK